MGKGLFLAVHSPLLVLLLLPVTMRFSAEMSAVRCLCFVNFPPGWLMLPLNGASPSVLRTQL